MFRRASDPPKSAGHSYWLASGRFVVVPVVLFPPGPGVAPSTGACFAAVYSTWSLIDRHDGHVVLFGIASLVVDDFAAQVGFLAGCHLRPKLHGLEIV